jgi:hypothetical protein
VCVFLILILPAFLGRDVFSCSRAGDVWLRDFDESESALPEPLYSAGSVERARLNSANTHFAYGGHENLVQYIDLETQTRVWDARNVPHDELDMRLPVWVKDLVFDPTDDRKIITSTHYHQVRISCGSLVCCWLFLRLVACTFLC